MAIFFVAMLMDAFALHAIYRNKSGGVHASRYGTVEDRCNARLAPSVPGYSVRCGVFFIFWAVVCDAFALVAVAFPSLRTESETAFWHTLPYLYVQIGRLCLALYLWLCFPAKNVHRSLVAIWCTGSLLCVVSYIVAWTSMIARVVEIWSSDIFHDTYDFHSNTISSQQRLTTHLNTASSHSHPLGR